MFGWRSRLVGVAALLALGSACGMTEKKFFKKLYKEQCDYQFACYEAASTASWTDEKGCRDVYSANADAGLEYFDGCRFKRSAAKECLKTLRKAGCGPAEQDIVASACDERTIWECLEDGALPPTGTATGTATTGTGE